MNKVNEYIKSIVRNVKESNQLKEDLQRLGNSGKGGGGEIPIKWGCAAEWGRIFMTGLTIMGLPFHGVANCWEFGGKKILAIGILKWKDSR